MQIENERLDLPALVKEKKRKKARSPFSTSLVHWFTILLRRGTVRDKGLDLPFLVKECRKMVMYGQENSTHHNTD